MQLLFTGIFFATFDEAAVNPYTDVDINKISQITKTKRSNSTERQTKKKNKSTYNIGYLHIKLLQTKV